MSPATTPEANMADSNPNPEHQQLTVVQAPIGGTELHPEENNVQGSDHGSDNTDDDNASDNDSSVEGSLASTEEYEQEPYDTFKDKCLELMLGIFHGGAVNDITIQRMTGGGYNRIIGANVYKPEKTNRFCIGSFKKLLENCLGIRARKLRSYDEYILRIPRFASDASEIPYHAATINFMSSRLNYSLPEMVLYSVKEDNPIGRGYSLERRLSGTSLQRLWDEVLNLEQKKNAARAILRITSEITSITHSCAGIISPSNTNMDFKANPKLEHFPIGGITGESIPLAKPQTTKEFMLEQIERRKKLDPNFECTIDVHDALSGVINKLYDLGFLPDEDEFCFYHLDFQPRNMLAEVDGDQVKITGLLDWDSAMFVPKFMAKRPPYWMWQEPETHDDEEQQALRVPDKGEDIELKKVFEDCADAENLRYAFGKEYVIARRIFHTILQGINSSWTMNAAWDIVDDFEKMYPPTSEQTPSEPLSSE